LSVLGPYAIPEYLVNLPTANQKVQSKIDDELTEWFHFTLRLRQLRTWSTHFILLLKAVRVPLRQQ